MEFKWIPRMVEPRCPHSDPIFWGQNCIFFITFFRSYELLTTKLKCYYRCLSLSNTYPRVHSLGGVNCVGVWQPRWCVVYDYALVDDISYWSELYWWWPYLFPYFISVYGTHESLVYSTRLIFFWGWSRLVKRRLTVTRRTWMSLAMRGNLPEK